MSDIASNIQYIDNGMAFSNGEESAGKIGKVFGVIAAIAIPFAAPMLWGALTASGSLLSGLGTAMTGAFGAGLTNVIGSAAVGGLMNAGLAYAQGARGAAVWAAGGIGALGAGANQAFGGLGSIGATDAAAAGASGAAAPAAGLNAIGKAGPVSLAAPSVAAGSTAAAPIAANAAVATSSGVSGTIANGIRSVLGNVSEETMRRVGAALVNAAVNGTDMGRLNALRDQQLAELRALQASDTAAYSQRIQVAQQLIQDADKQDPAWQARLAMADVAGMEATQFRQTQRNIATRQGGSLDAGQAKAYERAAGLHTARSKALAYNQKFGDATVAQGQLRGQAAGLFGPNDAAFNNLSAQHEISAGAERAQREADHSTWGGLTASLFEGGYKPATSPDPSEDENNANFSGGFFRPFGS